MSNDLLTLKTLLAHFFCNHLDDKSPQGGLKRFWRIKRTFFLNLNFLTNGAIYGKKASD
jgi:hypothetical protein